MSIKAGKSKLKIAGNAALCCGARLMLFAFLASSLLAIQADGAIVRQEIDSAAVSVENKASNAPVQPQQRDPHDTQSVETPVSSASKIPVPRWVEKGSYFDTEKQIEYLVIESEPMLKERESEEDLRDRVIEAVHEKVDGLFEMGAGKAIGIDLDYIREHLIQIHPECKSNGVYVHLRPWKVPPEYRDAMSSDERESFQCYAHLAFDSEFESWVRTEWQNRLVVSRTRQVGLIAISILAFVGILFAYFSAEHKTRGFYSRRLQTICVLAVAVAGLLFWWIAGQITWL